MATRTITECDRCRHEIKGKVAAIELPDRELDLCESCTSKLKRFLSGEDLEVPP